MSEFLTRQRDALGDLPRTVRYAIVGAGSAGTLGAILGLLVGLLAYPPTAWFAMFELGIPAAVAGGFLGVVVALVVTAERRIEMLICRRF